MATQLSGSVKFGITSKYVDTALAKTVQRYDAPADIRFSDGVGAFESDLAYIATRQIAISATDVLDLSGPAGVITNGFGDTLIFVDVTVLTIYAYPTNAAAIRINPASAANPWLGPLNEDGQWSIPPGGAFEVTNFSDPGWVVSPGTADQLAINNLSGSAVADYDIVIVGRSA